MLALIVALFAIEFIDPAILVDLAREFFAFLEILFIIHQRAVELFQDHQLLELLQQFQPVLFFQQLHERIVAGLDELIDPLLVYV